MNQKVADNAPDFLTIYGSFVAVTSILWFGHTIYTNTSIPKERQLRRIQGMHSPSARRDRLLTLRTVLAGQLYPDHTRFYVTTTQCIHPGPYSWRAINATSSWCATVSGYDASDQHHRLEDAFVCAMTADQALKELESRPRDMLKVREEEATRKEGDGRLD
jgi:hypothetical protein